jgi:hypothetical protein
VARAIGLLTIIFLVGGCDSPAHSPASAATPSSNATASAAGPSSNPTPAASPQPPYGVIVDIVSSLTRYQVALVSGDGSVGATVAAAQRTTITTPGGGHAADLPYVSTSLTSLYFLDGDSTVWRLVPGQSKSQVTTLPVGPGMEGTFAVSPDDSQLAYSVLDFNRRPVHVQLGLITPGAGGQRKVTFDSDSDYVWPVAWHSGLLVLAKGWGPYRENVPTDGPFEANPYLAQSYHLVDPVTAVRRGLLAGCLPTGPLVAAGTACLHGRSMGWDASVRIWGPPAWHSLSAGSLSPDGGLVAALEPKPPYGFGVWAPDGRETLLDIGPSIFYMWVGWLDGSHFVTGSDVDDVYTPVVVTVTTGGSPKRLPARGFFAARLPTAVV